MNQWRENTVGMPSNNTKCISDFLKGTELKTLNLDKKGHFQDRATSLNQSKSDLCASFANFPP